MEPEKPFACTMPDCGMTFTNEDHLHVHTKKHGMILQLGMEQKAAFVADQTPTPTRFIRNCEEVGLFQDLQNVTVNPFDEGFKRAMETKHGMLTLEGPSSSEDALHTPHLFPLESADCTLYTANNQRNITISRSSSDESGVVKEYETTKISTLTNEVTKISRIVGKDLLDRVATDDVASNLVKHEETTTNKDSLETSVSFTNNVIIHSNVEIRQDINIDTKKVSNNTGNADAVVKDTLSIDELVKIADSNKTKDKLPPIMSQKSLDLVVDSLNTDNINNDSLAKNLKRNYCGNDKLHENDKLKRPDKTNKVLNDNSKDENEDYDYEVIIKLPSGKHVRMKAADEVEKPVSVKDTLNKRLKNKIQETKQETYINNPIVQNIVPITTGTLIPVTLVNQNLTVNPLINQNQMTIIQNGIQKIPIKPLPNVKRKDPNVIDKNKAKDINKCKNRETNLNETDGCLEGNGDSICKKYTRSDLDSRSAASRRYRKRLRQTMQNQVEEISHLREKNRRLSEEKSILQLVIAQHLKDCPNAQELRRSLQEKIN